MIDDDALPTPPKFDLAENDKVQAELALRHQPSRHSQMYGRPMSIIKELVTMPFDDLTPRQKGQLIDAYVEVGEFDKAYNLSGDEKHKQMWDAVTLGTTSCGCNDFETVELVDGQVTTVSHSRLFVKREIYNVKTGSTAKLMACNLCGNAFLV